jgi:hypothetical protein
MSAAATLETADFARAMAPVARELLGEPSEENERELRFGSHGSLVIYRDKGTWHDFEASAGGGVIAFVQEHKRTDKRGAVAWLQERGHIPSVAPAKPRIVAAYNYSDEDGVPLFQVRRMEPKNFIQAKADGAGGWICKKDCMKGVRLVLYHLPALIAAVAAGQTIHVAEGEKGVHAIEALGLVGTCSPGGVGKWRSEYNAFLTGADVVILSDNDPQAINKADGAPRWHPDGRPVLPGQDHAADVFKHLSGIAAKVRVLMLPDLPLKGDVADWVAAGGTADALMKLTARIGSNGHAAEGFAPFVNGHDTTEEKAPAGLTDMLDHPDMSVLRLNRRPPPVLDLNVFGPRWAAWITTTAAASACPVDYVASPLLASASALIGNSRWPEAWSGWFEPPHLWVCGVGDSGGGKSPGADVLLRDVVPTLERRMSVDHPEKLRAWVSASEIDKAARERWEGDVREAFKKKTPPPMPPEAAAQHKPETPRLRQNDVTVEKVATLLATAAPKGLMIHRDELLGWVAGMDAYHDSGRAFWIEAYGGRPYRVERQKNPEPIDVPHLVVAAFGGTQPAKIAALLKDPDDGLLGRIIWFWPDPVPFKRGKAAPGVPWAIEALDHLRRLDLSPATPDGPSRPILVPLHESLHADMVTFALEMQARQQEAGGLMQSAYAKARGLVLRLSLVLTYLQWVGERPDAPPPAQITPAGFAAAAHLVADYLMPMAERVYGDSANSKDDRDAATLARWIMKTKAREVHVRTMQREVRLPGLATAADIHAAAEVLQEAGWLVPPKLGAFQQRARAAYPVNSRIFEVNP